MTRGTDGGRAVSMLDALIPRWFTAVAPRPDLPFVESGLCRSAVMASYAPPPMESGNYPPSTRDWVLLPKQDPTVPTFS